MKGFKLFKKILVGTALLSCLLLVFSCANDDPPEQALIQKITFSQETYTLDLDESITLNPVLQGFGSDVIINWVSDNASVVSVNEGVVTVKSIGEATVTASIGNIGASVEILVISGGKVPRLEIGQFDNGRLTVDYGQNYTLTPEIYYNSDTPVADAAFTYSVSGTAVSVNDEGLIIPNGIGEARVTVQGVWKSFSGSILCDTLDVTVRENTYMTIGKDSYLLYTSDILGGATSFELDLEVYDNGNLVENPFSKIDFSYNSEYLDVNSGTVSAVGREDIQTALQISFTSTLGTVVTDTINITIELPVQDHTATITLGEYVKDVNIWTINSEEIFDDGAVAVKVIDDSAPGIDLLADHSAAPWGENRTWTVYNNLGYGYKVKVSAVITKIINTASELANIFEYGDEGNYNADGHWAYGGYFVLGGNIDAAGTVITAQEERWDKNKNVSSERYTWGFNGIFDGRGYSVTGLQIGNFNGIFGVIGRQGVVKNVAFVGLYHRLKNNIAPQNTGGFALATAIYGGKVENILIDISGSAPHTTTAAVWYTSTLSTIKNFIIYGDRFGSTENPISCYVQNGGSFDFTNAFAITNVTKTPLPSTTCLNFNDADYQTQLQSIGFADIFDVDNSIWRISTGTHMTDIPVFDTSTIQHHYIVNRGENLDLSDIVPDAAFSFYIQKSTSPVGYSTTIIGNLSIILNGSVVSVSNGTTATVSAEVVIKATSTIDPSVVTYIVISVPKP